MKRRESGDRKSTLKAAGRVVLGLMGLFGLALAFQNCGAGAPQEEDSADTSSISGDRRLLKTPHPFEYNFNQIGYMSCPQSGKVTPPPGDHLLSPYFTLRFGGYDNATMETFGSQDPRWINAKLRGGIRVTQGTIDHLSKITTQVNSDLIADYISKSPYSVNRIPVATLINESRTWDSFAKVMIAVPLLDSLSNIVFKNYMANSVPIAGQGLAKRSYFSQAVAPARHFSGSINFGLSSSDARQFRLDLSNEMLLHLGTTDATILNDKIDPVVLNQALQSPDGDVTKRLFGKSYKLRFNSVMSSAPASTIEGWKGMENLVNITEWDQAEGTNGGPPVNLTERDQQSWSCDTLMIVRDIDRKYYKSPGGGIIKRTEVDKTLQKSEHFFTGAPMGTLGFNDLDFVEDAMAGGTEPVPKGVHFICPPMRASDFSGDTAEAKLLRDRLRIFRRFLPADYWELNLLPGKMCAVPLPKASKNGSCFASPEFSYSSYIPYRWNVYAPNVSSGPPCGTDGRPECPPVVTICYRKN